ncbi:MAG: sulfatase family protein [Planctomycetota bacterium]|jgi:arylsulfatase A-like enzyme
MADNDRPNLLIIQSDDHGQWALGCYGTDAVRSPNIDYLAEAGARMANAFTPTPVCSPGRACLFTGRFPSQHGVHDWLAERDPDYERLDRLADERTLYQHLSQAGYRVGHFGKWHCGRNVTPQPGVDRWFSMAMQRGGHKTPWPVPAEEEPNTWSDEGDVQVIPGYATRIMTDRAIDFIRAAGDDRPWAAYVGPVSTHQPHAGFPERLVGPYRRTAHRAIGMVEPPPDVYHPPARADVPELQAQYLASVTEIDEQVGRLIDALDETGVLDRTLVVYTADHGLAIGQFGRWEKGNGTRPLNMCETSIRIPMVLWGPGRVAAGGVRQEPVDLCDLFHTLLDYAGVSPDGRIPCVGGSFREMLAGGGGAWREEQYGEYGPVRMIRTNRHKLLRRHGHGPDQLFDLDADPAERRNRIDDPDCAALIAGLEEKLEAFFAGMEDPEKSGLRVTEHIGRYNPREPWDPRFDGYRNEGWSRG